MCLLVLWAVVRADEFDDIDGDPYDLLGVPYDASEEAVKKAYRSLSRRWHPDKNPTNTRKATKQFAKLSRAYEIVNDRKSRRRFDAHARMRAGSPPPAFDFDNLSCRHPSKYAMVSQLLQKLQLTPRLDEQPRRLRALLE